MRWPVYFQSSCGCARALRIIKIETVARTGITRPFVLILILVVLDRLCVRDISAESLTESVRDRFGTRYLWGLVRGPRHTCISIIARMYFSIV